MKRAEIQKRLKTYLPQVEDQFDQESEQQTPYNQPIQQTYSQQLKYKQKNGKYNHKKTKIIVLSDDEEPLSSKTDKQGIEENQREIEIIDDEDDDEIVNYMQDKLGIKAPAIQQQQQEWKWAPQPIPQKKIKHIHEFAPYIMLPGDVWPPNYFNRSYDPLRREIAEKRRNI